MSLEGVRNESKLELFTAVDDFPSSALKCEAGHDVFSKSILREASDVSDCPATENNAWACDPCTVHAVALNLVEFAIHVKTLIEWVVGRHIVESLEKDER